MRREAVATGKTIEEASEAAARMLGDVGGAEIRYEVIEAPVKKTLGLFGGNPAKVKAYVEDTPAARAVEYLSGIFEKMGLSDLSMAVTEKEGGAEISVEGEGLGAIIGRRGETLDALQYLASLACNEEGSGFYRIILNTGDYREKREKTLQALARRIAEQVLRTHRSQSLEPMNPYERRIIHTTVQEIEGVTSWSVSDGRNRRVIIGTEQDVGTDVPLRTGHPPRRYSDSGRPRSSRPMRSARPSYPAQPAAERSPKHDGGDMPLYGRIDK